MSESVNVYFQPETGHKIGQETCKWAVCIWDYISFYVLPYTIGSRDAQPAIAAFDKNLCDPKPNYLTLTGLYIFGYIACGYRAY